MKHVAWILVLAIFTGVNLATLSDPQSVILARYLAGIAFVLGVVGIVLHMLLVVRP
jgi:hypothetical protein